ncbi:hypothetical protein E2C01_082899 [Portunus trituberculatus]|uniref:Uncharacterized protein n=1 Tax=Portunus trituberculatus TaxID=210409 RepID=A0A5B7ITH9_PORTR|nr:hypothetical protein [Portunus trituberculatus]
MRLRICAFSREAGRKIGLACVNPQECGAWGGADKEEQHSSGSLRVNKCVCLAVFPQRVDRLHQSGVITCREPLLPWTLWTRGLCRVLTSIHNRIIAARQYHHHHHYLHVKKT